MIAIKGFVWVFGFTPMWEGLGEWRYRRLKKEDQRSRQEKFQPQILEQVEKPEFVGGLSSHDVSGLSGRRAGNRHLPPPQQLRLRFYCTVQGAYNFLRLAPTLQKEEFWKTKFPAVDGNGSPAELTRNSVAACPWGAPV